MKFDKQELEKKIRDAKDLSNEDKSNLLQLLKEKKTYGLVWEDSTEDAWEMMKDNIPVLKEDETKQILHGSENPNHILIEGDNLNALTALSFTHEGLIDVIYIDPPYNSGARDWRYNNDYVDKEDDYKHSKWMSMIYHRLVIAKRLLNPLNSTLIVTIDEKEFHHLGCLLEELFPYGRIQMISTVINVKGVARESEFSRVNEYIYIVQIGKSKVEALALSEEWLGNVRNSGRDKVRLGSLLRSGSNSGRSHSPGCFYPLFFTEDGRFVKAGDPIGLDVDRNSIFVPDGMVAIWPIHSNGTEGVWQYAKQSFEKLVKDGFVYFGKLKNGRIGISYAPKGVQQKIKQGLFKLSGYDETGAAIIDDSNYVSTFIPGNQWSIPSHNATEYGSKLLKDMFGDKVFAYPKSLYAVIDTLRFFVNSNKEAIILDFFAGSGTTLHATMQLNANDGGHRQCILVTNDENNICEEVTYERNKRVIEGYTKTNGEFVEGLKDNNLRYYKIDFKERKQSHQSNRELFHEMKDLLCIKEDIYREQHQFGSLPLKGKERMIRYFAENGREMLMVYDTRVIPFIVKEIEKMSEKEQPLKIYIFADGAYPYTDDFATVIDKVSLVPMPYAYYRGIKDSLPDVEPKKEDNTELTDEEQKQMMAEAIEAENNEKKED